MTSGELRLARGRNFAHQRGYALAECFCPEWAAEVAGAPLRIGNRAIEGVLDGGGGADQPVVAPALAEPSEQHRGGADQGSGIGAALPRYIRRRAVLGLRDGVGVAGIERSGKPQAAADLGGEIGEDV